MDTRDLLEMKVGSLIRVKVYPHSERKFNLGTVVAIWAPLSISVLMHMGTHKGKYINLRGFDFDEIELARESESVVDGNEGR